MKREMMLWKLHFELSFHIKRGQLRRCTVCGLQIRNLRVFQRTPTMKHPVVLGQLPPWVCVSFGDQSREARLRWFGHWGETVSTLLEGCWGWNCQAGELREDREKGQSSDRGGSVRAFLFQLAGYFVCIYREDNDTEKRILMRYSHLSHHGSVFFVFFFKDNTIISSVCSPSVQLQMDKAIPPLPALVVLRNTWKL